MSQKSAIVFYLALVIIASTFILYSQTMGFGFVNWDDDMYLFENHRAQSLAPENILWFFSHAYYHSYIPLTMISHTVDFEIWKFNPSGHHLTNVVLHAFNALWVFVLSLQVFSFVRNEAAVRGVQEPLFREVDRTVLFSAAFSACLYAWHPLRAESVAWVSDRKDLLCAFFLFPAVIGYINYVAARGTGKERRWFLASLLLFVCACLSKPIATTVPILFLVIDFGLLRRTGHGERVRNLLAEKIPFVVVAGIVAIVAVGNAPAISSSDMNDVLTPIQRVLLPFYNLVFYLVKTILPVNLSPMYPLAGEGEMIGAFVVFAAVTILCLLLVRNRIGMPLFVLILYVVLMAPSAGFLSTIMQTTADRYSYVPTVVFFLMLGHMTGTVVEKFRSQKYLLIAIAGTAVVAAGFLGFLNFRQQHVWRNSETLWGRAIDLFPNIPLPHNNLGLALEARGALAEAEESYHRALQRKPDYLEAHLNLGNIMFTKGNWDEAERLFQRAAALHPNRAEVFNNLGVVATTKGNTLDALHWFRRSVQANPEYAQGYFNLGVLYAKMGNTDAALDALKKAAQLGHPAAQHSLTKDGVTW